MLFSGYMRKLILSLCINKSHLLAPVRHPDYPNPNPTSASVVWGLLSAKVQFSGLETDEQQNTVCASATTAVLMSGH